MKKLILLTFLVAAGCRLKAQMLFNSQPADTLSHRLLDSYFKPQPNKTFYLLQPKFNAVKFPMLAINKIDISLFHSLMPVAVFAGDSKMPVVKINGQYTMPIKWISGERLHYF